ncbi:hypothetical protein [Nostoc sp. PCC 9305]|uniref:hypothetical protein n=1 Tax=Nostoc sp. PCC 9305 TaxID=296636 RepID=UPI0039C5BA02
MLNASRQGYPSLYHLTRVLFNKSDAYGGKLRIEVSQTIAQYSILLALCILNSEFGLGKRLKVFAFRFSLISVNGYKAQNI